MKLEDLLETYFVNIHTDLFEVVEDLIYYSTNR